MTTTLVRQTMFTTGEVDVNVWKRTDIESYMSAAQILNNMEVGITGLCKKRKGTKSLLDVTAYFDPNAQLYEFVDKNQNYYIIMSNATADDPAFLTWNVFKINSTTDEVTYYQSVYSILDGTTPLPYSSDQLKDIDYALDNDSLVLTHGSYKVARIYVSDYTDPVNPVFSWEYLNINPYPAFDFNNINYNAFPVTFTSTATSFSMNITCPDGTFGTGGTSPYLGGQIVSSGNTAESPIGYGIITSVTQATPGAGHTTIAGTVYVRFAADADMPTVGSGYSIRQPAWSVALGYPAKVLFYQNRLWVANTLALPGSVFGSRINQPVSFDVGTGRDTDAIIYNIGQSNSGDILWMNGGKQLEIYSENFEFVAPQEQNLALTPSTFSIRQQSAYGSSTEIKPTTYINDSYYVTRTRNAIINFHFTGIGQAYVSSNISLVSQHLVKNPVNRALLRGTDSSQDNFIYYLNDDNSVTSFQFATEYKLAALAPIEFDQNVVVKDVVAVNNKIYFLKNYDHVTQGAIQTFEVFVPDVKMDGYITATMIDTGFVNGLEQFNGYNVQITYTDGSGLVNDLGVHLVSNGQCFADNPNAYSGDVQVGILYNVHLRPMYITPGSTKYSSASSKTYDFKNINRIYVDYVDSLNFYINSTLVQYQSFNTPNTVAYTAPAPQTDTAIVSLATGWDRFSTFDIIQTSPFDLQITGIAYQIETHII